MLSIKSYAAISILATILCICHEVNQHKDYYPIMISLATSKLCVTVLGNMMFVLALLFAILLRQLFLGRLRAAELDKLLEKIWFAITETCLALTIFREELKFRFVFFFTFLLFCKVFHWLLQFRIEQLHTELSISRLTQFRITSLIVLLQAVDIFVFIYVVDLYLHEKLKTFTLTSIHNSAIVREGPSFLLLFAFEFIILYSTISCITCKFFLYWTCLKLMQCTWRLQSLINHDTFEYIIHQQVMQFYIDREAGKISIIEIARHDRFGGRWAEKAVYTFYLNLFTDLFQLFVYLAFFAIIFSYYGIPLHIVRELYSAFGNLRKRISDFARYRRIIMHMNTRFATATHQDLAAVDRTCIVCREEMHAGAAHHLAPKKLPCSHIFHFDCLRSWLEDNTTCPTCRNPVESDPASARDASSPARQAAQRRDDAAAERPPPPASERVRDSETPSSSSVPPPSHARGSTIAPSTNIESQGSAEQAKVTARSVAATAAAAAAAHAAAQAAAEAHARIALSSLGLNLPPSLPFVAPPSPLSSLSSIMPPALAMPSFPLSFPLSYPSPASGGVPPMLLSSPGSQRQAQAGHTSQQSEGARRQNPRSVLSVPEIEQMQPLQNTLRKQVEIAERQLDELLAAESTDCEQLKRLRTRIQELLLPMVASQCTYIESLRSAYATSATPSSITPVKQLKLEHLQRDVEGRQRELRDLVDLCTRRLEDAAVSAPIASQLSMDGLASP